MRWLRTFNRLVVLEVRQSIEYPIEVFIRMFDVFFVQIVMLFVWEAVLGFDATESGGAFLAFYIFNPLFVTLSDSWHGRYVGEDIRNGSLSQHLLRPASYLQLKLARNIAQKLVRIPFVMLFLVVGCTIFSIKIPLESVPVGLVIISLFLSFFVSFGLQSVIGLLAFWTEEISSLSEVAYLADITLGGRSIPTYMFPPFLYGIAQTLPFRYTAAFPLEIFTGSLSASQIYAGFAWQVFWATFFFGLTGFLWKQGIKKYSAYGG